jgi:hypothetical protein
LSQAIESRQAESQGGLEQAASQAPGRFSIERFAGRRGNTFQQRVDQALELRRIPRFEQP